MLDYGMKILQQMIRLVSVLLNFHNYVLMEVQIDYIVFIGKVKKLESLELYILIDGSILNSFFTQSIYSLNYLYGY